MQSFHDIRNGIARCQHEDRYVVLRLPQTADNFKSSHAGKHNVQDDHVEWIRSADVESFSAIVCQHDRMILLLQTLLEKFGHLLFILDDQYSHLEVSTQAIQRLSCLHENCLKNGYFLPVIQQIFRSMV